MSVVIPVKDDADHLRVCLAALAAQTVAPFEVIVVDNASVDDSAAVAAAGGASVVFEPHPGIAAAASTGYDAALGDIIARIDADSEPPAGWIERIVADLADPEVHAVTGPGTFPDLSGPAVHLARYLYMEAYFLLVGSALAHWPLFGSNFAMRASAWRAVRCAVRRDDPEVHDDMDLSVVLGRHHRIRLDRELTMPISARPFSGLASMWTRNRRAFHTLRVGGRDASPVRRWRARIRGRWPVALPSAD
ncbi:glycosyltransferase family 2 protein [Labedella endophytica]|uniref:glycosyltransferase family 2 protein n=1 Tax=Labedella endophytica TaxID=1523160 RepID=UPI001FB5D504|nr:glycosyltransferase family 2 protein [Labedella endophytica]